MGELPGEKQRFPAGKKNAKGSSDSACALSTCCVVCVSSVVRACVRACVRASVYEFPPTSG